MSLSVSLQPPLSSVSVEPAEVREEKRRQEEEEKEAEMEEQERIDALLQRKRLLQELGVVDQLRQLLQGRTGGGGDLQDAKDTDTQQHSKQRQQQRKVITKNYKCGLTFLLFVGI